MSRKLPDHRKKARSLCEYGSKYVAALEEHGLIRTERTNILTKGGLKRNGCLKYTILPIQNAIDLYHERQMVELEQTNRLQKAQQQAAKMGLEFTPSCPP